MGCGCNKRADKILKTVRKRKIRIPKKVERFLEKKAAQTDSKEAKP